MQQLVSRRKERIETKDWKEKNFTTKLSLSAKSDAGLTWYQENMVSKCCSDLKKQLVSNGQNVYKIVFTLN